MQLEAVTQHLGDAMRDAVIIATTESVASPGPLVVWCNRAFTEMTGYSADEIKGKSPRILQGPKSCRAARDRIRHRLENWLPVRERILNYTKDGREFWVELDIHPVADNTGWYHYWVAIQRDVTDQVLAQENLDKVSNQIALCVESGGISLWDWTVEDDCLKVNQKTFDMLALEGRRETQLFSMADWQVHIHPDDASAFAAGLNTTITTGQPFDCTYRISDAHGDWHWWRSMGSLSDETTTTRITGVSSDITEIKNAEAESKAASQTKTDFLANMSHEIRTPLNGIMGMTQLLEETLSSDVQHSYLTTIKQSGEALLSIINDVLDIATIESGELELSLDTIDVGETINAAIGAVEGVATSKGIALAKYVQLDGDPFFELDEKHLTQVLINLTGNAIKFTDSGQVSLQVIQKKGWLTFEVIDTGPGIDPSNHEKIFQRFTQSDSSSSRKHGGTGLGLAIAKDLVAMMGGELKVESSLGHGAKFYFSLPLGDVDHAEDPAANTKSKLVASAAALQSKTRVLVAEDHPVNQQIIREVVSRLDGFEVEVFENGVETVDALQRSHFDCILMDINMPLLSGDRAIQLIRNNGGRHAGIPIFVQTADADIQNCSRYLALGADDCILKPLNIIDLRSTLTKFFSSTEVDPSPAALPDDESTSFASDACKVEITNDVDPITASATHIDGTFIKLETSVHTVLPQFFRVAFGTDERYLVRPVHHDGCTVWTEIVRFDNGIRARSFSKAKQVTRRVQRSA